MPEAHLSSTRSILIVDDDDILRGRLARAFSDRGWAVMQADGFESAVTLASQQRIDRAVIDLRMPGLGGLELLRRLQDLCPSTAVVVLTGFGSITNAVEAMRLGATNYVTKPADADQILAAFELGNSDHGPNVADFSPPSLAEAEWEHIQRVLGGCGGNISEAARLLDIPRRTLQRKLKKLPP